MMNKSGQGGIADTLTSKKTLRERFKNTEGEIQKHRGRDLKTLRERFKNTMGETDRSLSILKSET